MRLIAGILRLLGCIVLAAATVLAVGDVARSLASDRVRLMTIAEAVEVAGLGPSADAGAPSVAADPGVFAADGRRADPLAVLGMQPASVVLGFGGVLLLALGRAPRRADERRSTRRRSTRPGKV